MLKYKMKSDFFLFIATSLESFIFLITTWALEYELNK